MHITRNTKNRSFAIPADAAAIPPNPKTAAISAIIRKVIAHPNIYITSSTEKSHPPFALRAFTFQSSSKVIRKLSHRGHPIGGYAIGLMPPATGRNLNLACRQMYQSIVQASRYREQRDSGFIIKITIVIAKTPIPLSPVVAAGRVVEGFYGSLRVNRIWY